MRKRGAGVSQIRRQQRANDQYREIGNNFADRQMEQMKSQLQVFKSNLVEFSRKYRKSIRKDPVFRQHFQTMCSTIGVDPLASNKGFWSELLGVGDFYYELGIQIIGVCLSTRGRNGGLVELGELKRQLTKMRSGGSSAQEISDDDIIRSIKTLKPLGNGFEILPIGDRKMVRSVPRELNKDQTDILVLAQERGYVTKELLSAEFGWGNERINDAIDTLLVDGLCWIDEQVHPPEYWVPSFFKGVDD
ncbi:vacuolar-sorting protein SNF8 [Rhizophagus irregularis]|uniref:Vacuolar-sorting protein SNF8 n=2 Tax=Rhizophagus irregularis TaxID=588596 RepID=A0A2N0PP08_9GLOM|nr:Snf8p [Rhizophagus irregularis DAOM 197198w]PKC08535.1 vacuolar-sorting protein SNF8 [Rhizophagus irregularis]GBC21297.1 vacuolar-sorting protein SNF8 [Rhizophagus irregularis DAOM 181602=DAOM 197198]PKC69420.1 vacuolar-sorting protein SNF8 [Rhizophagus irregularis]PKK78134.1 vacuolar-sorting protein SNF8 [Rhizophagus irregularis]